MMRDGSNHMFKFEISLGQVGVMLTVVGSMLITVWVGGMWLGGLSEKVQGMGNIVTGLTSELRAETQAREQHDEQMDKQVGLLSEEMWAILHRR